VWAEGGLWSDLGDMARWIVFQLGAYREQERTGGVLPAATLREMHRPRYLADGEWTQAWGISWCGQRTGDTVWITHSGFVPGFTSSICFDPQSQIGAIMLLNREYVGISGLAIDLAQTARAATLAQVPDSGPPTSATPDSWRPLLGLYARPGLTYIVRVELRHGRLAITGPEPGGWRMPLAPTSDPDVYAADPDSPQAGDQVRFHRTAAGRVSAISLFDATFARLDPVVAG
ncbi:MAG: serine hydrolase, partial [Streptosporangiaceae bacterium]